MFTWIIQTLMRVVTGWCFIRKDDERFLVSFDSLDYKGDENVVAGKHRPWKWKTFVCFRVPKNATPEVYVMIDIYTGRRLALLGRWRRVFAPGQLIALKVGHEAAELRLASPRKHGRSPWKAEFIGRWTGDRRDLTPGMKKLGITPDQIVYI